MFIYIGISSDAEYSIYSSDTQASKSMTSDLHAYKSTGTNAVRLETCGNATTLPYIIRCLAHPNQVGFKISVFQIVHVVCVYEGLNQHVL